MEIINSATPLENTLLGVHPRLYASEDELACVRANVENKPYASLLKRVLHNAETLIEAGPPEKINVDMRGLGEAMADTAMAWKMTGNKRYLEAARNFLLAVSAYDDWDTGLAFGQFAHGSAVTWDWLYHDLKKNERETIADRLLQHGQVFFDEWAGFDRFVAFAYTWNHTIVPLCGLTALAGALYGEKPGVAPWLKMATEKARLMTTALGPDGISAEGQAYGQFGTEYMAKMFVLLKKLVGVDLIPESDWWRKHCVATLYHTYPRSRWKDGVVFFMLGDAELKHWCGPDPQLRLCAGVFRDKHGQWLANELHSSGCAMDSAAFLNLLWHDATVEPAPPTDLPPFRHFKDSGLVFMRSGWDGDESVLAFKCGPHSGHWNLRYNHNISGGHMHPGAGSIALFACGDFLLTESGYSRKWTAYENTLLVNGCGQIGEGSDWFEDLEFRKGHPCPRMLAAAEGDPFDFAIGDATNAYSAESGLKRFVRHVYFLKSDCWILVDELEAENPSRFELLYHGRRSFVAESDSRFLQKGGNGTLFVELLMPEGATGHAELQALEGIGATHSNSTLCLLTLSNTEPMTKAVFVTFLHAFTSGTKPKASVAFAHGTLTISRGNSAMQFGLDLARKDIVQPALNPPGIK